MAFWEGTIVTRFLRPLGSWGSSRPRWSGAGCSASALFSLPLLLVAPLLGVDPLPASRAAAGLLSVVSLALAVAVGLALDFIFAALMV